jgi:hypothetical protein
MLQFEGEFLRALTAEVQAAAADTPSDARDFVNWFEALKSSGPGQGDPLFHGSPTLRPSSRCAGIFSRRPLAKRVSTT